MSSNAIAWASRHETIVKSVRPLVLADEHMKSTDKLALKYNRERNTKERKSRVADKAPPALSDDDSADEQGANSNTIAKPSDEDDSEEVDGAEMHDDEEDGDDSD